MDRAYRQIRYNSHMAFFDLIVEERIRAAQQEGAFDNLPGRGRPLDLEDDSGVPEDLRLTYKVLKNSNCLPVEMELRKEFFNLRKLLNAAVDETTRRELRRELNLIALNLNLKTRRSASLDLPQV
jgi:DnaJ homologue, subfamily C, member 28, conserved domain